MWDLYQAYVSEMRSSRQFDPIHELAERDELPAPPGLDPATGNAPAISTVDLGSFILAYVESAKRTDLSRVTLEVTIQRFVTGEAKWNLVRTSGDWEQES